MKSFVVGRGYAPDGLSWVGATPPTPEITEQQCVRLRWSQCVGGVAPTYEGYTASERFEPASSPDFRLASTNSSRSPSSTFCVSERSMPVRRSLRSEEHTSELQSLMRISYAVFCL